MKGFTLIESVVVIAILAILALASVSTITEFQRNAILTSTAQELASTMRVARTDSMSGLIQTGKTYEDGGYPIYGVRIGATSYDLTRTFTLAGGSSATETMETHMVDPSITIAPTPLTIVFDRPTGTPNTTSSITLSRTGTSATKTITVNANGLVSL